MNLHRHARWLAWCVVLGMTVPACAGRFEDFTKRFANNPDQAKVVSASYIGGAGSEWLVGGGFQTDGTVVLVGTALGPTLEIAGTPARVLGRDTVQPDPVTQQPNPRKAGQMLPLGWDQPNATAFVALLSPDLKTVKSLVRFPWKAAGATSAVLDSSGAIYIAGVAGDAAKALSADAKALPVDLEKIGQTNVPTRTVYLAKLAPKADKVEWIRLMTGPSNAPVVDQGVHDEIRFQGPDVRTFDASGNVQSVAVVPGGMTTKNAVNPVDGTFAYGHEHNWPTGREPWRCPVLKIYEPDGKLKYHLYDWGGPFVGLGEMRLVSDTAVRSTSYDKDGNLILGLWSDGGNSVALREPMDVYKLSPNIKGLGMSSWGAGVLSLAYILKIDTKTYRVKNGTIWAAYLTGRDKPNSIWVDSLGFGMDGSVVLGGRSAGGLIQTGNNLNPYTRDADPANPVLPSGTYVAVLNSDMNSLRFSSAMVDCAETDIANGNTWAFRSGFQNGKPMLLVMSGAVAKDNNGQPAPTTNALQPSFGGGITDGHVLVLDLSVNQ